MYLQWPPPLPYTWEVDHVAGNRFLARFASQELINKLLGRRLIEVKIMGTIPP